jgi:hypothetical protein
MSWVNLITPDPATPTNPDGPRGTDHWISWPLVENGKQPDYADSSLQYKQVVAQITVEETHTDDLAVTDHPVEMGAEISDHAYKKPAELVIRLSWSNSDPRNKDQSESYVHDIYQQLLDVQAQRVLLKIGTNKRIYKNMLITSISTGTTAATATTLNLTLYCRQIIIVNTQTTSVPPRAYQKIPEKTAAPEERGQVQAKPAQSTVIRDLVSTSTGDSTPRKLMGVGEMISSIFSK